jgi:hypothetical protein
MEKADVPEHLRRLPLEAAARVLGCSDKRTLLAALHRNGIPIVRLGRERGVLVVDLERLVAACTYPAGKANAGAVSP